MKNNIIKDQVNILSAERALTKVARKLASGNSVKASSVGGLVALASSAAESAADTLDMPELVGIAHEGQKVAEEFQNDPQGVLLALAELMSKGHSAAERVALEYGLFLHQGSGGTDKTDPARMVSSILGLG